MVMDSMDYESAHLVCVIFVFDSLIQYVCLLPFSWKVEKRTDIVKRKLRLHGSKQIPMSWPNAQLATPVSIVKYKNFRHEKKNQFVVEKWCLCFFEKIEFGTFNAIQVAFFEDQPPKTLVALTFSTQTTSIRRKN